MIDTLTAHIALNSTGQLGARGFAKLRAALGSASLVELWSMNRGQLISLGVEPKLAGLVSEIVATVDPNQEVKRIQKLGLSVVVTGDKNYPPLLKEIFDPPALLYVLGELPDTMRSISIVGSRKSSQYGRRVCSDLASGLVTAGCAIVSGLAFGIDASAHQSTLDAGGKTIAVLANGLDIVSPRSNYQLAKRIVANQGALVSEFPPATPAWPTNFPVRNRIIAGLTLGTIIVEAYEKSGTSLTASSALDYNREVMTVPHSIYSPGSVLPHRLLRQGAALVTNAQDVLEAVGLTSNHAPNQPVKDRPPDDSIEFKIWQSLAQQDRSIDELSRELNLTAAIVTSKLVGMELKGYVTGVGWGKYARS